MQSVPVLLHGKVFSCSHGTYYVYTHCFWSCQTTTEKSLAPTSIFPFHQVFIYMDKIPSDFSSLDRRASALYSISLTRFLVPYWTWTVCKSPYFSCAGETISGPMLNEWVQYLHQPFDDILLKSAQDTICFTCLKDTLLT